MGVPALIAMVVGLISITMYDSLKDRTSMKMTLRIIGLLLLFVGGVWFLQGINVLPGSFMTGQMQWAVYGGIAFAVGIVLTIAAGRIGRNK
jgi:hypothetical protein